MEIEDWDALLPVLLYVICGKEAIAIFCEDLVEETLQPDKELAAFLELQVREGIYRVGALQNWVESRVSNVLWAINQLPVHSEVADVRLCFNDLLEGPDSVNTVVADSSRETICQPQIFPIVVGHQCTEPMLRDKTR